jgi:hypothetical protein
MLSRRVATAIEPLFDNQQKRLEKARIHPKSYTDLCDLDQTFSRGI